MVKRLRGCNLSALRHSRSNLVAFVAGYFLMLGMVESYAECLREFRTTGIPTQLMTSTTRRDIAAAGLRARSVASITNCVRTISGLLILRRCDRWCRSDSQNLKTVAHDTRRRADDRSCPVASDAAYSLRDDDREGTAAANDFCCCA